MHHQDLSNFRVFWEAFRPATMGNGPFLAALLGLLWLVVAAALAE